MEKVTKAFNNAMNVSEQNIFFRLLNEYIKTILDPSVSSDINKAISKNKTDIKGISPDFSLHKLIAFHNTYDGKKFDQIMKEESVDNYDYMQNLRYQHNILLRQILINNKFCSGIFTSTEEYKYHMKNIFNLICPTKN